MTRKKNSKNKKELIGTNLVPGTVVGAEKRHIMNDEPMQRQVNVLDLSEDMTSETIDRFYAEKNVRQATSHFNAEVAKYGLFAPVYDNYIRRVWIRNLYYILRKYVQRSLRSQYEADMAYMWSHAYSDNSRSEMLKWPSKLSVGSRTESHGEVKTTAVPHKADMVRLAPTGAGEGTVYVPQSPILISVPLISRERQQRSIEAAEKPRPFLDNSTRERMERPTALEELSAFGTSAACSV
jgi:hypothetical protein